jgi:hypothetical protein
MRKRYVTIGWSSCSRVFGLSGKRSIDGSKVSDAILAGRFHAVVSYCGETSAACAPATAGSEKPVVCDINSPTAPPAGANKEAA